MEVSGVMAGRGTLHCYCGIPSKRKLRQGPDGQSSNQDCVPDPESSSCNYDYGKVPVELS